MSLTVDSFGYPIQQCQKEWRGNTVLSVAILIVLPIRWAVQDNCVLAHAPHV